MSQNKILLRVYTLYILFFGIIICGVAVSILGTEFLTGINDATIVNTGTDELHTSYLFAIPNRTSDYGHSIELGSSGNAVVSGRIGTMDLRIADSQAESRDPLLSYLIFGLAVFAYLSVFVLIILILGSVRKTVARGTTFDRKNISRCRAIAILIICAAMLSSVSNFIDARFAASVLADDHFTVDTSLRLPFGQLIAGILVLFVAETFALGHRLSEEQKLTI